MSTYQIAEVLETLGRELNADLVDIIIQMRERNKIERDKLAFKVYKHERKTGRKWNPPSEE